MPLENNELLKTLAKHFTYDSEKLTIKNTDDLIKNTLDDLVYACIFAEDDFKDTYRWLIRETAIQSGIIPSSIQSFYEAKAKGKYANLTVPAINIRGLTYDTARAIFRCAQKNNTKAFLFEIAKSEIGYTKQRPSEYSTVILGAAIKEGYRGPVFFQGDHFQVNAKKYAENEDKEVNEIKELIKEAIQADFYNIDIDASTIVDLSKSSLNEQQFENYETTSILTEYIRKNEPQNITVSVGGEIGEVGGKNSTVEELEAFLTGFANLFKKINGKTGLSKISVQTGTSHGGVVMPDGSIAKVKIDFDTLKELSKAAKKHGLSGAVQHGASTLPEEAFDKFQETDTAEIHLATGFQNIIYDSPNFPVQLKNRIIEYIHDNFIAEKKESDSDEQFVYKTRKKAFGPFKKELFDLSPEIRSDIGKELEDRFTFLFKKLNATNTQNQIDESIKPIIVKKKAPSGLETLLK